MVKPQYEPSSIVCIVVLQSAEERSPHGAGAGEVGKCRMLGTRVVDEAVHQ